jgi:DNA processing protein
LLRTTDFPPTLLYAIGDSSVLSTAALGIVGSRKASEYGGRNAYWMTHELSHAGLLICSGMARGIDTQAHKGALAASGTTVAVLGTGIDICYPSVNRKLAEEIAVKGVLISEFPLGSAPRPCNFPQRN